MVSENIWCMAGYLIFNIILTVLFAELLVLYVCEYSHESPLSLILCLSQLVLDFNYTHICKGRVFLSQSHMKLSCVVAVGAC